MDFPDFTMESPCIKGHRIDSLLIDDCLDSGPDSNLLDIDIDDVLDARSMPISLKGESILE